MNLLSEFEARLEGAVEGMFGAMFRSPVQPAELARAAGKEMARSRKLGVDKLYVSNVYFVFISPRDADTLSGLIPTLEGELETYLLAFARERDFELVTRPIVRFTVDESLKRQGKFDIIGQQMTVEDIFDDLGSVAGVTDELEEELEPPFVPDAVEAEEEERVLPTFAPEEPVLPVATAAAVAAPVAVPVPVAAPAPTAAPTPAAIEPTPLPEILPDPDPITAVVRPCSLFIPGRGEVALDPGRVYVAGRHSDCDFPVQDANVSRKHAEFFWDDYGWNVRDLGSTNGTLVNDRHASQISLRDGDRITFGVTTFDFSEPGGAEH